MTIPQTIIRKPLLTALLRGGKAVGRVEIKQIDFDLSQQTGLHLHPCPVVGYIVSGSVHFQVEGEAAQFLKPGDAFFEPANTPILHFDNASDQERLTFIAFYLLGVTDHDLITMLA